MTAVISHHAFSLGPGVYKMVIDYDGEETVNKFDLKVYGTRGTPKVSVRSPSRGASRKDSLGDEIVIKLNGTRKFQVKETLDEEFTESGDYHIVTVTQEVFFKDAELGWVKVGEMFSSYPKTGANTSPDSHDYNHENTYYGKFFPVKKSEFRAVHTDADFTEDVPSMKDGIEPDPIDMMMSVATLNDLLTKHNVKLSAFCQCFHHEFATQYLKANGNKYRNNAKTTEMLKTLNGLTRDNILGFYGEYKKDIEKLSRDNS
jgi:hypothetical protein